MTHGSDEDGLTARQRKIRQHLGGPVYRRLFAAVRRRLEEVGERARIVTLRGLDEAERRAIADLLAWPVLPADPVRVVVARLDQALRESRLAAGLGEVVEALGGPLIDRRLHRETARAGEEAMWRRAAGHPVMFGKSNVLILHQVPPGALASPDRSSERRSARFPGMPASVVAGRPAFSNPPD